MVRAGGKSNSSKPAPVQHAAPAKPHAPATTPAAHTPAATPAPQVTNIYVQRAPPAGPMGGMGGGGGPGLMGMMAATVGGSIIGNGVSHMLFNKSEPAQPAQQQQLQQAYAGTSCQPFITSYGKCLEANNGNADACKWAWESFTECDAKLPKA